MSFNKGGLTQRERIAVLESQVGELKANLKEFNEKFNLLMERQEILANNDVMMKEEIDELKPKKETQYFG